MLEAEAA